MTASDYEPADTLHLWWLADPSKPRLVGTLRLVRRSGRQPGGVSLEYTPTWLASGLALSEDLPLRPGEYLPAEPDAAAGAVDDARPDRWGERVIRLLDRPQRLSTMEYLWFAGDNRFGALGVSASADAYKPRWHGPTPALGDVQSLAELIRQVEAGEPVSELMRRLVTPGATLGGARPKALLEMDGAQWVLKFGETGDPLDSPLVEHASMTLAARAGIEVCETRALRLVAGHAVAVRRFDRAEGGAGRLHVMTARTALRAAGEPYGYPELALLLRRRAPADQFAQQGEQLFCRMVFNILLDNTDDHEQNHALLVDGRHHLRLSPAYDVLPSGQAIGYQQMRVGTDGAEASIVNAVSEHRAFAMTRDRALQLCTDLAAVVNGWQAHFRGCGVSNSDIAALAQQIDRPFLLEQRAS